ncbi:MAG: N-6 DNA methylase [Endozoicomonadaceae bacterium]|nr:N-6 DNA methylase [Endozoicomonadaceae bacterium]
MANPANNKIVKKIHLLLDQLKRLGAEDSALILVDFYYLATILPIGELNRFLSFAQADERVEFLSKHNPEKGPVKALNSMWCQQLAISIDKVEPNLLKNLFSSILQDELPNADVAKTLLYINQNLTGKKGGPLSGMPIEVAELSQALVNNYSSTSALCMGNSCNSEALISAQQVKTRYELKGAGFGQTVRNKLFKISGLDIDFPDLSIPDFAYKDPQKFSCGYLTDAWGVKHFPITHNVNVFNAVSSEVSKLEEMIERVSGKIVCAVPSSFLFRTSGADAQLKKFLLLEGYLESVIQLPERIVSYTAIAPALLIINTLEKSDSVQFIDASGSEFINTKSRSLVKLTNNEQIVDIYSKRIASNISEIKSIDKILIEGINLDVKRYVKSDDKLALENSLKSYKEKINLGEIAELVGCQAINASDEDGEMVIELGPININNIGGIIHDSQFKQYVPSPSLQKRLESQTLHENDIVFTIKGTLGKCALITEDQAGKIANQSFCIIKLKPNNHLKSPQVLLRYLQSDLGQLMVENVSSGATVKMLKMKDLQDLVVPVPSMEQQDEIEQNYQEVLEFAEQIRTLEAKINQSMKKYWSV